MNKNELVASIAKKSGLSRNDADRAIDALLETLKEQLSQGGSVALIGFGTFSVNVRKARMGRNVKTQEPVAIPEKKVAVFKAGSKLKEAVNASVGK